jgi:catechol 2,3-dioxygenase-like lactoylglutathione lyase family enzyme
MTRQKATAISPSFIVSNVEQTIAFYRDKLGFETRFQEPDRNPFFAIIGRDGAQIFVKAEKDIEPVPNSRRHRHLRGSRLQGVGTSPTQMRQRSRPAVPHNAAVVENLLKFSGGSAGSQSDCIWCPA